MHRALLLTVLFTGCAPSSSHFAVDESSAVAGGPTLRGMNIDPRFGAPGEAAHPTFATMRELGVTQVRFTFKVPNDLDEAFAFYDQELSTYAPDFKPLFILTGETLEGATPNTLPDSYIATFADRAGKIAAHYGTRVRGLEIWNEEDDSWDGSRLTGGSGSQLEPSVYAKLLNQSFDAIKAANPDVKVVVGGLDSGVDNYLDRLGDFRADAIATHPYGQWPGNKAPNDGGPWFGVMKNHIAQYARHRGGRELWFTEWGTNEDVTKARNITAFFQEPAVASQVAEAYFFGWTDQQDPARGTFGITTDGVTHKEDAWNAFKGVAGPPPPPPPPQPGPTFAALVVKSPVGAGFWITQCTPDRSAQLVWKTSDPSGDSTTAAPQYSQALLEECVPLSGGVYPLLFTSWPAGQLEATWVTECAGAGTRHVFRVQGAAAGHPIAPFLYDEPADDCP